MKSIPIYKPYLPKNSLSYAHEALDSTWISSQGKYIQLVEEKLKELLQTKYVLLVNNGTSACHLMAKSLSYKHFNQIIVPDNVYAAAWNAFLFDSNFDLYSIPCDINTWNIDLVELDKAINQNHDAAVLIVHNIGNIINVPELQKKYPNATFVEDNCEGFLGRYNNKQSGTESYVSAISFFGNKTITSGQGGALITNDEETYLFTKCAHAQGQSSKKFVHNQIGYNYRITNVEAAILYGQLIIIDKIIEMKQNVFETYRSHLKDREDILMQSIAPNTQHANWMFGIRIPNNVNYETAELYFKNKGIEIRPMFYSIDAHAHLKTNDVVSISDCANAKLLNKECFILPSFPELSNEEQGYILKVLDEYVRNK